MPQFKIKHLTKYKYQSSVRNSANQIILYPINDPFQEVLRHELLITEEPVIDIYTDYYGNQVGNFTNSQPHAALEILSKVIVNTKPKALPLDDIFASEQWTELNKLQLIAPYIDFLKQETFTEINALHEIVKNLRNPGDTPFITSKLFCQYVYQNFNYIPGVTTVETTLDELWSLKAGVCQDFAHILLVMLRLIKIPARYVSGYICPHKSGMRGDGATHAWVEAYIPNYGWLGLDPTNNCIANELHVRLAVGRNFSDCSPVKGVYNGTASHTLEVTVNVSYEDGTESKEEPEPAAVPQFVFEKTINPVNSYQRHLEILQQQQQQQQ